MSDIVERRIKTLEDLVTGLSAPELLFLDGVVAGTATASKAVVLGASKEIATITSATITTLTSTTVNATTVAATTGTFTTLTATAINAVSLVRQTADVTATTNVTLANLTGLSQTVVAGTYAYKVKLQCLSTVNGGTKVAFKYTTATLTSLQNVALAFTASAVAQSRVTSTTDQASLVAATVANTQIELSGTMVVSAGGTVAVQGAQNASHADTTTFYTGSTFELVRIA